MNVNTTNMKLAFIGSAHWDLWVDLKGKLWAIPKPTISGCKASHFGDKHHIKRLMERGYFNDVPTDAGLALLEGLHNRVIHPGTPKSFAFLGF
jgi:hypothetical protein